MDILIDQTFSKLPQLEEAETAAGMIADIP
jgi:hypothetical protein